MVSTEFLSDKLKTWPVFAIGVLMVIYAIRSFQIYQFKRKHNAGDAPVLYNSYKIATMIFELLRLKSEGKLIDTVHEMFEGIGDNFRLMLFGIPITFTREPENVKAILATQFNDFVLGSRHAHFFPLLGDGIFTLDGAGWKHLRALLRPQFTRDQVAHVRALEPHLQILAQNIRLHKGNTINIQDYFFKLTVDTATEFLFGESVGTLKDDLGIKQNDFAGRKQFAESFNIAQLYLATRSWSQFLYFMFDNKDFRLHCKNVHTFAEYYVKMALEKTPEELDKMSESSYVFLYELAKETRNAKVLQDQLLNILIAGRDTTAGLLSFTYHELAKNPRIWKKLKEEIHESFGDDINSITFELLKKCEYLKWVINEALRLYPSVPINFRVTTKDTTLPTGGGKDGTKKIYLSKGTTVAYAVYSTHRMEKFYGKDALEFVPERWADGGKWGWAYLPFNGGPRICLGQQFALTEASYILVRLAQLFPNLEDRDPSSEPILKAEQLTMSAQNGVLVSLTED